MQKQKQNAASRIAQLIDSVGYIALALQWLWTVVLYLPLLLESDYAQDLMQPQAQVVVINQPPVSDPSIFGWLLPGIILAIMLMITAYVIYRMPRSVTQAGSKLTKAAVHGMEPLIIRSYKKPISIKKRRSIELKLTFAIKIALVILALVISMAANNFQDSLPSKVVVVVALYLALISLGLVCLQAFVARLSRGK